MRFSKRGEIATILAIGTLIVLGIATLIGTTVLPKKTTTNTKAAEVTPKCASNLQCSTLGEYCVTCTGKSGGCPAGSGEAKVFQCDGAKSNPAGGGDGYSQCDATCSTGPTPTTNPNNACTGSGTIKDCDHMECDTNQKAPDGRVGEYIYIKQVCNNGQIQSAAGIASGLYGCKGGDKLTCDATAADSGGGTTTNGPTPQPSNNGCFSMSDEIYYNPGDGFAHWVKLNSPDGGGDGHLTLFRNGSQIIQDGVWDKSQKNGNPFVFPPERTGGNLKAGTYEFKASASQCPRGIQFNTVTCTTSETPTGPAVSGGSCICKNCGQYQKAAPSTPTPTRKPATSPTGGAGTTGTTGTTPGPKDLRVCNLHVTAVVKACGPNNDPCTGPFPVDKTLTACMPFGDCLSYGNPNLDCNNDLMKLRDAVTLQSHLSITVNTPVCQTTAGDACTVAKPFDLSGIDLAKPNVKNCDLSISVNSKGKPVQGVKVSIYEGTNSESTSLLAANKVTNSDGVITGPNVTDPTKYVYLTTNKEGYLDSAQSYPVNPATNSCQVNVVINPGATGGVPTPAITVKPTGGPGACPFMIKAVDNKNTSTVIPDADVKLYKLNNSGGLGELIEEGKTDINGDYSSTKITDFNQYGVTIKKNDLESLPMKVSYTNATCFPQKIGVIDKNSELTLDKLIVIRVEFLACYVNPLSLRDCNFYYTLDSRDDHQTVKAAKVCINGTTPQEDYCRPAEIKRVPCNGIIGHVCNDYEISFKIAPKENTPPGGGAGLLDDPSKAKFIIAAGDNGADRPPLLINNYFSVKK